jgi:hypothetical protein
MKHEIIDAPIYEATHRGYWEVADKQIPCAVLENGKRIISQTGLFDAFDRPRKGEKRIEQLPSIVGAKNLLPFVTDELIEKSQVIYYKHTNGKVAKGYDAEVIPVICELYIDASESGELHSSQEKLADRAMMLIRALAKVGITALIDEATGYQYDRESQELQRLLEVYIAKDLMKWQKRFPNQYYKEIYRLYGWEYNPESSKRPQYIGNFTNKYVYDLFPEEVIEEIKKRNPVVKSGSKSYRKNKNFQYLTTDIGLPQLDNHISKLLGVMKLSDNIEQFKRNFDRAFEEELSKLKVDEKII